MLGPLIDNANELTSVQWLVNAESFEVFDVQFVPKDSRRCQMASAVI